MIAPVELLECRVVAQTDPADEVAVRGVVPGALQRDGGRRSRDAIFPLESAIQTPARVVRTVAFSFPVITLSKLISYLDDLLEPQRFADYGPNGLQVPGATAIETVATGVSASVELFERAAAEGAQLVLVHHGLFWGEPMGIDAALHRRLRPLFAHDLALAAYHLPLDGHLEVGNNALLAAGLRCEDVTPFAEHKGTTIGVAARFGGDGITADELAARVAELCGRPPLHLAFGPERVRSIGIVSGGGSPYLQDAIDAGLDAYLTGEPVERVMTQAREAGMHFLAGGHYATETFGVRRLGELLAERFGVRHVFLDDPNPI